MKRVTVFLIMVLLLCSLACCGKADEEGKESSRVMDFYKSEEEMFEIHDKPCTLYFPTKWRDKVHIETEEQKNAYTIAFFTELGGKSLPLYKIVFGESEKGYLLGTIQIDTTKQSVYIVDTYSDEVELLSEQLKNTYYEMCEGINDVISGLVYKKGMQLEG